MDRALLELLVCPETKMDVSEADQSLINSLNQKISQGVLKNRGGHQINESITGGLIRVDGKILYPVRDDIPIMIVEESIEL